VSDPHALVWEPIGLFITRLLTGVGLSAMTVVGMTYISEIFPANPRPGGRAKLGENLNLRGSSKNKGGQPTWLPSFLQFTERLFYGSGTLAKSTSCTCTPPTVRRPSVHVI
jgi:hypothetical protein